MPQDLDALQRETEDPRRTALVWSSHAMSFCQMVIMSLLHTCKHSLVEERCFLDDFGMEANFRHFQRASAVPTEEECAEKLPGKACQLQYTPRSHHRSGVHHLFVEDFMVFYLGLCDPLPGPFQGVCNILGCDQPTHRTRFSWP